MDLHELDGSINIEAIETIQLRLERLTKQYKLKDIDLETFMSYDHMFENMLLRFQRDIATDNLGEMEIEFGVLVYTTWYDHLKATLNKRFKWKLKVKTHQKFDTRIIQFDVQFPDFYLHRKLGQGIPVVTVRKPD